MYIHALLEFGVLSRCKLSVFFKIIPWMYFCMYRKKKALLIFLLSDLFIKLFHLSTFYRNPRSAKHLKLNITPNPNELDQYGHPPNLCITHCLVYGLSKCCANDNNGCVHLASPTHSWNVIPASTLQLLSDMECKPWLQLPPSSSSVGC